MEFSFARVSAFVPNFFAIFARVSPALTFEIIYGHAFKPAPRMALQAQTLIPLEQMRESLRAQKLR